MLISHFFLDLISRTNAFCLLLFRDYVYIFANRQFHLWKLGFEKCNASFIWKIFYLLVLQDVVFKWVPVKQFLCIKCLKITKALLYFSCILRPNWPDFGFKKWNSSEIKNWFGGNKVAFVSLHGIIPIFYKNEQITSFWAFNKV